MTSLILKTRRSPFQQVREYHPTHSNINFPNCVHLVEKLHRAHPYAEVQ